MSLLQLEQLGIPPHLAFAIRTDIEIHGWIRPEIAHCISAYLPEEARDAFVEQAVLQTALRDAAMDVADRAEELFGTKNGGGQMTAA